MEVRSLFLILLSNFSNREISLKEILLRDLVTRLTLFSLPLVSP